MDQTFASVNHYYSKREYDVTILAAPTNVAIYPDKLPPQVDKKYRDACQAYGNTDNLLFQLRKKGLARNRYKLCYPFELFKSHRDKPYFYPKEKWHWQGRSAFLFARDLLVQSGVVRELNVGDQASLEPANDDLSMFFGFSRHIMALSYPYSNFQTKKKQPAWQHTLSEKGKIEKFVTDNALSEKRGLLLSNSFGKRISPTPCPRIQGILFFQSQSFATKRKNAFLYANCRVN